MPKALRNIHGILVAAPARLGGALRVLIAWSLPIVPLLCGALPGGAHAEGSVQRDRSRQAISLCPSADEIPPFPSVDRELSEEDIYATADSVDLERDEVSILRGNAQISLTDRHATADVIEYFESDSTAQLRGNVRFWGGQDSYVTGSGAQLDLDADDAVFVNAHYLLNAEEEGVDRIQGDAERMALKRRKTTHMEQASYTTCLSADPLWELRADTIDLDHEQNRGTGRHAKLYFFGMPLLYSPWVSFPLKRKRKSGLLVPSYGNSNRNGIQLQAPWYWNIAPEQDATITPVLFSDNGGMLMGEYRYLLAGSGSNAQGGQFDVEYMPADEKMGDEDRSFISWRHSQRLWNERLRLDLLYNNVSDKTYFEDLGQRQSLTSSHFLERVATLGLSDRISNGDSWSARLRLQDYQSVDANLPAISRPYKRLPEWFMQYRSKPGSGFAYGADYELTHFDRSGFGEADDVTGIRHHVHPYLGYRMAGQPGHLEPRIGVQYKHYQLNGNKRFKDSVNRAVPVFSVDGALAFERRFSMFGDGYFQTLEPRLYYLYIPERNQDDTPIFDTGKYTFNYNTLFYENRFSGRDRIGDANQLTVAVGNDVFISPRPENGRYRLQRKLASLEVGQVFYFRDREVTLPGAAPDRESSSALVGQGSFHPWEAWQFHGDLQWDPHSASTDKGSVSLRYRPGNRKLVNLSYRYRDIDGLARSRDNVEQVDASAQWRISGSWGVVGRWNYALQDRQLLEAFFGVEFNGCCVSLRLVGRRFLTGIDGEFSNGFLLQVALKGLVETGTESLNFLKGQIPGYDPFF